MTFLAIALLVAAVASCVYACVYFAQATFIHDTMGASFGFTALWIFGVGFACYAVIILRGPSTALSAVGVALGLVVAGKLIEWFALGPIVDRFIDRRRKGPPA